MPTYSEPDASRRRYTICSAGLTRRSRTQVLRASSPAYCNQVRNCGSVVMVGKVTGAGYLGWAGAGAAAAGWGLRPGRPELPEGQAPASNYQGLWLNYRKGRPAWQPPSEP